MIAQSSIIVMNMSTPTGPASIGFILDQITLINWCNASQEFKYI